LAARPPDAALALVHFRHSGLRDLRGFHGDGTAVAVYGGLPG